MSILQIHKYLPRPLFQNFEFDVIYETMELTWNRKIMKLIIYSFQCSKMEQQTYMMTSTKGN